MTRLQASRLQSRRPRQSTFLGGIFPQGSIQRKIFLRGVLPLLSLLLLAVIVDKIVMPIVTRHGSEFPLPDFSGQRMFEVQVTLSDLDLEHEISSEEYSPGSDEGVILGQFPIAGTNVKPGRKIKFVVSLGQKSVSIPEMHGLSVRQAILDLETVGLKLGEIAWAVSDTIPERVVVWSFPEAGTQIPMGSAVNLMVNRGRSSRFTYMPRVVGLPVSEAIKRLEDKWLKPGIITPRVDENYLPETVLEQSEPEGAELDVDTEIDLVVSTTE